MKVEIVFIKPDGTEIPYESMSEEERRIQAERLNRKSMEQLGYVEVKTT